MDAELGSRVLIADGDPALRQRLSSRLLGVDIFSDCVANGQDALEKLDQLAYTVVVLDLELAGIDAGKVLARIAQLPARPVVLVSADERGARALEVEIVQIVLRKPVDVDQLAELVRNCVRTVSNRQTAIRPIVEEGPEMLRP